MAIPTTTINERTTLVLTLTFLNDTGDEVDPDAATLRIDDVTSNTVVRAVTALVNPTSGMEVEITSAENAMKTTRGKEERVVTVEFDYGIGRHGTQEYRYYLAGLVGVAN